MKKYIIGLFSAICLMGAGCSQFEDFSPVDMGEGPAVSVTLQETSVDAFDLTVTPGEGAVYYAYIVSKEAMNINAENLLKLEYDDAVLVKVADKPAVTENLKNQDIGVTYYVYAVAANSEGLCGSVTSASLELPDNEAPYIVDNSMKYNSSNYGRTITITFNEKVVRGEGAINYSLNTISASGDSFEAYQTGSIPSGSIDISNEKVKISLPEEATLKETQGVNSYVFITLDEGAFVDGAGNKSRAMSGFDDTMTPLSPWWIYTPGQMTGGDDTGTDVVIEIDDAKGYGDYIALYASADGLVYTEQLKMASGTYLGDPSTDYGLLGIAAQTYYNKYYYVPANVVDGVFQLANFSFVGNCQAIDGNVYNLALVGVVVDDSGEPTGFYDGETIPFVANEEEPRMMSTDVVLAYLLVDQSQQALGLIDVLYDYTLYPLSLIDAGMVKQSFTPAINKAMNVKAVEDYIKINGSKLKFRTFSAK